MLHAIRERITGIVAIIIFGFLAILLIPFGAQNFDQGATADAIAKVGDSDITRTEFETSFNNYRQRLRQLLGSNFDELAYSQPLVRRQHLDALIDQRLLQLYADDSGLVIPPSQLTETVRNIPAFQVAGVFNEAVYQQALASQRMDEARYLGDVRRSLVNQTLSASLQASARPTDQEVNAMLALQNQTRNIDYVLFPAGIHVSETIVEQADIEAYYNENTQQFMSPEQVSLSYLEVNADDFAITEELDEELLRDRYENQRNRFMTTERRQASHILLTIEGDTDEAPVLEQAESLSQRARDGEDFASLAEEFSQDPGSASTGGDLGWIEPGVMTQAFEDKLFELEVNEVSEPVRTGFGYHVIMLRDIEPSTGKSFEEAREELAEEARSEMAERQYLDIADELVDLSFEQPDALQPAADELGLDLQQTELFTRGGGSGIAARPEIIEAAFSDLLLLEQTNSDPIQLGPNHILVARIREHVPSTPRPLEEVEVEVRNILQRQQASEMARAQAAALLETAISGGSLEAAVNAENQDTSEIEASESAEASDPQPLAEESSDEAAQPNLQLVHVDNLTRTDFQLGQTFLQAVFGMNLGEQGAVTQVVPRNGQDWAVVRLNGIASGDASTATEAERQRISQQLQRSLVTEEQNGLLAQLRDNYEITVYEDRL